jgi:hypothetical protein
MPRSEEIKTGDLVIFDLSRMTHRGGWSNSWDLKAVMMVLRAPPPTAVGQIALVLMNGKPTSVGVKHLRLLERDE